jgi:AAA+ ATPase superfamily predicted ATPase
MSISIEQINEAFSPTREIRMSDKFIGRVDQIKEMVISLSDKGSFLAIYGLRGVGKSSFAVQVKNIAEGDEYFKSVYGLDRFYPKTKFNNIVIYIHCDSFIKTIPDLLKRIMFGDDKNRSLFSYTTSGDKYLSEVKKVIDKNIEGKSSWFSFGFSKKEEQTKKVYISDDLIQQFRNLLNVIKRDNPDKDGLLIIIDEFDIIKNKEGFSSIVKSCSGDFTKFSIAGIATDFYELLRDHSSIGRSITTIKIPTMSETELTGIIERAEVSVKSEIKFDGEAKSIIAKWADGFPFFVHLIGKECMLYGLTCNISQITRNEVHSVIAKISEGKIGTIYEDIYLRGVKQSEQREILLKIFSESNESEIKSETVYEVAKGFNITNPSQYMKELTTSHQGSEILIKIRDGYYRFNDPVFKVYARIRSWKH